MQKPASKKRVARKYIQKPRLSWFSFNHMRGLRQRLALVQPKA